MFRHIFVSIWFSVFKLYFWVRRKYVIYHLVRWISEKFSCFDWISNSELIFLDALFRGFFPFHFYRLVFCLFFSHDNCSANIEMCKKCAMFIVWNCNAIRANAQKHLSFYLPYIVWIGWVSAEQKSTRSQRNRIVTIINAFQIFSLYEYVTFCMLKLHVSIFRLFFSLSLSQFYWISFTVTFKLIIWASRTFFLSEFFPIYILVFWNV